MTTRLIERQPLITFVTLGELIKRAEIRHWGASNRQALADWVSGVPVLPDDEAVANTWGRLSAAGVERGRPRPVNDRWIAACCLTHDLPLATLNLKDFEDFRSFHRSPDPRRRLIALSTARRLVSADSGQGEGCAEGGEEADEG